MNVHINPSAIDYQERCHANNVRRSNLLLARLIYVHGRKKDRKVYLPAPIYPDPIAEGFAKAKRRALRRKPMIQAIILAVSQDYGVAISDIIGPRRTDNVVRPRQVAMYLARELTPISWRQIGIKLGRSDHTSVEHGYRKINSLIQRDSAFRSRIASIRHAITGEVTE